VDRFVVVCSLVLFSAVYSVASGVPLVSFYICRFDE
jgi:hypothetical protein